MRTQRHEGREDPDVEHNLLCILDVANGAHDTHLIRMRPEVDGLIVQMSKVRCRVGVKRFVGLTNVGHGKFMLTGLLGRMVFVATKARFLPAATRPDPLQYGSEYQACSMADRLRAWASLV